MQKLMNHLGTTCGQFPTPIFSTGESPTKEMPLAQVINTLNNQKTKYLQHISDFSGISPLTFYDY